MTVGSKKSRSNLVPPGHNSGQIHNQSSAGGSSSFMDASFIWKLAKLGRVGSSHLRFDDDWIDRLNYQITCFLHFLFIGVLGIRSYIGKPIQCWAPQEFNKAWEEYSENFCWVSNTFFTPINHKLPLKIDRSSKMIGYYQWTPIVLACQALLFYLPCLLWRLLMRYSGFNVRRIIQMAGDTSAMLLPEMNTKNIRFLARYMDTCIERNYRGCRIRNQIICSTDNGSSGNGKHSNGNSKNHGNSNGNGVNGGGGGGKGLCRKLFCHCRSIRHCHYITNYSGRFLFTLYISCKLFYILNIILQLYLMKRFLGTESSFFGIKVLLDLINGVEWNHSGNFPRVTFCEVQTKKLGENNVYNLQCVLPLNMFLEKIYIFLWFYYVALGVLTVGSLISWLARMAHGRQRHRFVRHYLRLLGAATKDTDNTACMKFAQNHLRPDGVFLLHLVAMNVGHVAAGDLVVELWNIYRYRGWHGDSDNVRYLDMDCRHPFVTPNLATGSSINPLNPRYQHSNQPHHHHHHQHNPSNIQSKLDPVLNSPHNNNNNNNNNNSEKSNNHDDIV